MAKIEFDFPLESVTARQVIEAEAAPKQLLPDTVLSDSEKQERINSLNRTVSENQKRIDSNNRTIKVIQDGGKAYLQSLFFGCLSHDEILAEDLRHGKRDQLRERFISELADGSRIIETFLNKDDPDFANWKDTFDLMIEYRKGLIERRPEDGATIEHNIPFSELFDVQGEKFATKSRIEINNEQVAPNTIIPASTILVGDKPIKAFAAKGRFLIKRCPDGLTKILAYNGYDK